MKRLGDWKLEEETMEADAIKEKEAAERDYQRLLDGPERHRLMQVDKVAKKR